MAIVQCVKGHYYDDRRDAQCPYCAKLTVPTDDSLREQVTSYLDGGRFLDDEPVTQAFGEDVEAEDKTIGIFTEEETRNALTAGWLVCMTGPVKGKSYPFFVGRNFAGRSPDMDMVLSDDAMISREKHFSVIFDPRSLNYYLLPGSGIVYLNESPVTQVQLLREGDRLKAGNTEYIFVPFCKEGRLWT